jgi:hypothetical protein
MSRYFRCVETLPTDVLGPFETAAPLTAAVYALLPIRSERSFSYDERNEMLEWMIERFGESALLRTVANPYEMYLDTSAVWVMRATGYLFFGTPEIAFEFKMRWA